MWTLILLTTSSLAGEIRTPTDALAFSANVSDPLTRTYLNGHFVPARTAFSTTMALGGFALAGGIEALQRGNESKAAARASVGLGLLLGSPFIYRHWKRRFNDPQRFWTFEERQLWREGLVPTHGLRLVVTSDGPSVVNRSGRILDPVETALRLGDRDTWRRLRRQEQGAWLLGYGMMVGGAMMATEGLGSLESSFAHRRVTGIAAAVSGAALIPIGVFFARALSPRRTGPHWSIDELHRRIGTTSTDRPGLRH